MGDVFNSLIGVLGPAVLGLAGYFLNRNVSQFDENIKALWTAREKDNAARIADNLRIPLLEKALERLTEEFERIEN